MHGIFLSPAQILCCTANLPSPWQQYHWKPPGNSLPLTAAMRTREWSRQRTDSSDRSSTVFATFAETKVSTRRWKRSYEKLRGQLQTKTTRRTKPLQAPEGEQPYGCRVHTNTPFAQSLRNLQYNLISFGRVLCAIRLKWRRMPGAAMTHKKTWIRRYEGKSREASRAHYPTSSFLLHVIQTVLTTRDLSDNRCLPPSVLLSTSNLSTRSAATIFRTESFIYATSEHSRWPYGCTTPPNTELTVLYPATKDALSPV
jgi:hypothetical protein